MAAKPKFVYNDGFDGRQHSQSPVSTGTSVLGIAFDKGVIIACDDLVSYGSLARFRGLQRVFNVNKKCAVGCGGDYADFQYMLKRIEERVIDDEMYEDGQETTPDSLHTWITRIQYNRRSKFDPLWLSWVIGGIGSDGKPFLGSVDKLGTAYKDPLIATGFGAYLAIPLMRKEYDERNGKFTQDEAMKCIQKCMETLYYRDARSWNEYHYAIITADKSEVVGPVKFKGNWDFANMVTGYE